MTRETVWLHYVPGPTGTAVSHKPSYIDAFRAYWNTRPSSGHRDGSDQFYAGKAAEHAALLTNTERTCEAVDLGTGAGELLVHFRQAANVTAAQDLSQEMLAKARARVQDDKIHFTNEDVFEFVSEARQPVWLACGSLNQYLHSQDQAKLLDAFSSNEHARSLFYFDTIDPLRYRMWGLQLLESYVSVDAAESGFRSVARRWKRALRLTSLVLFRPSHNSHVALGSMGFAYSPQFWHGVCAARGLRCEIVSSRYYEYRYHVIVRK